MNKNLSVFVQFGFKQVGTSGSNQVKGNCVFCGSQTKFHINEESKKWDCKVCGLSGGYHTFLTEVLKNSQDCEKKLEELSGNRGIDPYTLKRFKVGYFSPIDCFVIPHFCQDGENLNNLRIYNGDTMVWAAGADVSLFNLPTLNGEYNTVWICEGEWDTMVMDEIIRERSLKDEVAIGVPGALVFTPGYDSYLKDKVVNVVYDNDLPRIVRGKTIKGAGVLGMHKVFKILNGIAKEMKFIHWREGLKNGYDIRDLLNDKNRDHRKTLCTIKNLLNPLPPEFEYEALKIKSERGASLKGDLVDYKEVHKVYQKWLHITDTDIIDVMFSTVIANRMQGDPIWLFLVAKSGDAKSVFVMSLSDSFGIISTTSLTPQSLISGFGAQFGNDPSLIPKLNGKVLTVKDFTTVLSMNPTVRDEIFGILRDAYDGKIEKTFGNGIVRAYNAKFGVLAGVTPAIELYTEGHTALGERFLRWKMRGTDDAEIERLLCRKAMDNTSHEEQMQKELSEISKMVLNHNYQNVPEVPEDIKEKIISLSQWTAIMRGTINRDKYSKEITHKPFYERPTRLTKQFYKMLIALGQFRNIKVVTNEEYTIVKHIGVSTAPTKTEEATKLLYKVGKDKPFSSQIIRELVGLPEITVSRMIENLCILNVLERKKIEVGLIGKYEYRLTSQIKKLIFESEVYN